MRGRPKTNPPVHRAVVAGRDLTDLGSWASEVEHWPEGSHAWGHYYEEIAGAAVPCRTENVSACHDGFRKLVAGPLREVAAGAAGADVVDFKDKINYKHPGGGGFAPHQDLRAYPGASGVMSILLALDECTEASGCLWLAQGVDELLPTDAGGVVDPDVVTRLEWTAVEMSPGDALCLPGLAPHFSRANTGATRRRVLVASYAPVVEGYTRDRYYRARDDSMRRSAAAASPDGGGDGRISTLDDFEGRRTSAGPQATGPCTHG